MQIDLKWGLPFVLPFVSVMLFRAVGWVAGTVWTPEAAGISAVAAILCGVPIGLIAAMVMNTDGIKWLVRVGK